MFFPINTSDILSLSKSAAETRHSEQTSTRLKIIQRITVLSNTNNGK